MIGLHPQATNLSLLIAAEPKPEGFEEAIYVVVDRYPGDMGQEQRADLYALLAEKLDVDMTVGQMTAACSQALWNNQDHWTGR